MSTAPVPATTSEATETEEQRLGRLRNERRGRRLGTLVHTIVRAIYRTLRIQVINPERLDTQGKGAIFVTWHGRSLIPANNFRNKGYWALISFSRDGEIQNTIFQRLGFLTIRGSTGRGGVRAALQMARKLKEGDVLAFTPDGPRGPTHKVQGGVILIAEKSGTPIIPMGCSADRRWLMKSWDSYMIPKPFARAYFILGEPIYVPPDLDDAARKAIGEKLEFAINRVEKEAERLAGYPDYPAEWRVE